MNSDVIRISTDSVIEIARNRSSTSDGSGRIRNDKDGEHAECEREIAAF